MDNPWINLPSHAPYVLPEDANRIARHSASSVAVSRIETSALPFPFLGRRDAPVVFLHLNPGLSRNDVIQQEESTFRSMYFANLRHDALDYPCFLLDPAVHRHPGYSYWRTHLKTLVDAVGARKLSTGLLIL